MHESIPLVDLKWQHSQIATDVRNGWDTVLASCQFLQGEQVGAFEQEYACFEGLEHCASVANGTDAIELAARAAGLQQGDAAIVPANTFVATALALIRMGVEPVLADCDPDTFLLDPQAVAHAMGPRVRAVVAVHLFGQMAPMRAIADAAGPHVCLIEDAAQSQGARQDGRTMGNVSLAVATSFYPGKNLGAYGDAGAVLTQHANVDRKVRALRNYGSEVKYFHPEPGFNSRLDELQAVVLRAKLRHLAGWNEARAVAAQRYVELLAAHADVVRLPTILPGNTPVWHLCVVRVARRDEVARQMQSGGFGVGVHYPTPLHLQGALGPWQRPEGSFPHAERAAREMLSLPMYPGIEPAQQERVVACLVDAVRGA